jgi:pimeloyl-ACP methyl ester carboxylesterase
MRRLHVLLTAQSALLVLASINRLWDATDARVLPHGSLRIVDVVNLLVLAPASALVLYLMLEHGLGDLSQRARRRLRLAFLAALYLFAASYGMHEPADFVHAEFCGGREHGALCESVGYHDDELSHGLFFVGLAGMDAVLLPGPFRGVLPLPTSTLRVVIPVLRNPLNRGRAIALTLDQFKYGWANALDGEEAERLYETYHVATPAVALMQMAYANLNPRTEAKLDPKNPARGPLLFIEGEKDHTVPWAIANASFKRQRQNPGVTEIEKVPNRGHSLTIDSGWREVAERALAFVKRFVGGTTEARASDEAQ